MANIKINPTDKLVFDLEMLQVDYNEQKKEALRQEIAKKYNVPLKNVEVNFVPITINENGEKLSLASNIISDIQDPKFQQNLFKEFLKIKNITDIDFDELIKIDERVNAFIDFNAYANYKPYKIKYLKWDNYLSYGKGNFFDFTKLNGLVLLTGQPENTSGKTTLAIDLLRFALFGKADKSPTLDSVFNTYLEDETEVMVEACIEIEGVDYVIRRTITRPSKTRRSSKSKAKQKVEYFKIIDNNWDVIENCSGEDSKDSNNIIRKTIGNVEDFDLVISATAYSLGNLLRMGQTDKGKLFSRWLGLLSIEEKEKIAKDLWKKESSSLYSNMYNKSVLENENEEMSKVIEIDTKSINEDQEKINQINDKLKDFNQEKLNIMINRKQIKEELIKADVLTIENNIKSLNNSLSEKRDRMKLKKERYNVIKDSIFDKELYDSKNIEERKIEIEQAELRATINSLKEDNSRIAKLIEQKLCPTCGQQINTEEQTSFITKNNKKIEEFVNKGIENKKKIDALKKEISDIEQKRNEENELNRLKPEMSAIKVQIDNIKLQLKELERQKSEIETNRENICYNNEIDNKVRIVDEKINTETRVKEQKIREIQNNKNEIDNYQKEIDKRNKIISKITEEEKVIRTWNIYNELVGKNGIVKLVLRKALPIVNNEISRLLNGLCDFDVKLTIDDTNKICINMIRDGVCMDLATAASGWENTISSLALRSALANICTFAHPNFTVADEILSGVSSENTENIFKLFNRINNGYSFIIHICHDNSLVDYHNQTIIVTKENNISKVVLK